MTEAATAQPRSWREETRRDRLVRAQIDREREGARAHARIAEREAAERVRQAAAGSRRAVRAQARAGRAARRAAVAAWAAAHVTDLLFVPVIAVPAVLAWTAMAAYGATLYGAPGRALPAFSEGAMWAFAAATTITRHRHPGRPAWHLRLGTAVFAVFGAALNFTHGLTAYGPAAGAVMALVSVAGVTAHQLVTAGPRRSPADRDAARTARLIARRELAARRAAIRRARVNLGEDGNACLVIDPGPVDLGRRRRPKAATQPGAARDATPAGTPAGAPEPVTDPAAIRAQLNGHAAKAEKLFAADVTAGRVPGRRRVMAALKVGDAKARLVQEYLRSLASPPQ